jgi:hypothetical protein
MGPTLSVDAAVMSKPGESILGEVVINFTAVREYSEVEMVCLLVVDNEDCLRTSSTSPK